VEQFRLWLSKGIPTVSIIPDRNWNLTGPREKALKVQKFHEAVDAAKRLNMPILVGTEMNADGQKFVDTFAAPEMELHRQVFLDGARFAWGHTLLRMTAGVGCTGKWAERHFGGNAARRNEFFQRVGRAACLDEEVMLRLKDQGDDAAPEAILRALTG
jgi:hypothetical protein